ncbi:hypothetical protein BJF96_g3397 [Verticillium dahliae]|uniref:Uncharacterized protein n=1 Tax=Verticillium dahliae TaxID=27337 RepID=A0AA44WKU3_VERDA|nr:hypothetical protein BJF96_g3397 [Verticillium dahliae]
MTTTASLWIHFASEGGWLVLLVACASGSGVAADLSPTDEAPDEASTKSHEPQGVAVGF